MAAWQLGQDDSGGRYVWRERPYQWAGLSEQTGSGSHAIGLPVMARGIALTAPVKIAAIAIAPNIAANPN